jgi:hypothetical protein
MLWPVILPWRQKNIRDCKVIGVDSNLFKAPIGPFSMATQPSWVTKQDRVSPGTSLWQIRFGAYETKTKIEVHAFLPYELVPLLEEYLSIHRRVLIGKSEDPGTLFVNNADERWPGEKSTEETCFSACWCAGHMVAVITGTNNLFSALSEGLPSI